MFKWPDRESLDDGLSSGVKVIANNDTIRATSEMTYLTGVLGRNKGARNQSIGTFR